MIGLLYGGGVAAQSLGLFLRVVPDGIIGQACNTFERR